MIQVEYSTANCCTAQYKTQPNIQEHTTTIQYLSGTMLQRLRTCGNMLRMAGAPIQGHETISVRRLLGLAQSSERVLHRGQLSSGLYKHQDLNNMIYYQKVPCCRDQVADFCRLLFDQHYDECIHPEQISNAHIRRKKSLFLLCVPVH